MYEYIIFACFIIIVLVLLYWVFVSDRSKRESANVYLQKSVGIFDTAARHALDTLDRIRNPNAEDHFNRGRILHRNYLGGDVNPTQRRTISRIVEEYNDAMRNMVEEPQRHADFIIHEIDNFQTQLMLADDEILLQFALDIGAGLARSKDIGIKNTVDAAIESAKEESTSRASAVDKYFDNITVFTNNNQNVHDSKVNNDLRITLANINRTTRVRPSGECIAEARNYASQKLSESPIKIGNVDKVLNKISENDRISTFDDTEANIFASVWSRCDHPANSLYQNLLKDAIITSLLDCVESGQLVCINGRCARILSSLATIDFDDQVGSAMTYESYRNQIFQETKNIVAECIIDGKKSTNEDIRRASLAYEIGDEYGDDFKLIIKKAINANIEKYNGKLTQSEIESISNMCYAYGVI